MDLIATKRCFFGKQREPGDRFSMPRQFARQYIAARLAKPAPETAPAKYTHRAILTTPRRVDMQAAKPAPLSAFDHDGDGKEGSSAAPPPTDDLTALRREYTAKLGKRPFPGWGEDELRRRMAEAD